MIRNFGPTQSRWKARIIALLLLLLPANLDIASGQEIVVPHDIHAFDPMMAESIERHVAEVRHSPYDAVRHLQLGMVYLANGAPALAERVFTICIGLDGNSASAYYYRARARYDLGIMPGAISDLDRACSLDRADGSLHWRLGFWLLEDGQTDAAELRFAEVMRRDATSLPGMIGLAMADLARRDYKAAAEQLEGLIARDENHPYVYHLLAASYRGLRRQSDALRAGVIASGQRPPFTDARDDALGQMATGYEVLLLRSRNLLGPRRFDESLAILDEARDRYPNDPIVLNYYSYVYTRMGQLGKARDVLLEALRIDTDHVPTHLNLSFVYEQMNQASKAIDHANRAIELNPQSGPALLQRGRLALLQNDGVAGADYLRRATQCGIHEPEHRVMYGRVLASQQKWSDSATVFQQVVQNDPNQSQAWAGLAICLAELGDRENARSAASRAREIDPNNQFVLEATRRVQAGRTP